MKEARSSESTPGAGSPVAAGLNSAGAAGKQPRVPQVAFGAASVDGAAAAAPVRAAAGDVENPAAASGAVPVDDPVKKPAPKPTITLAMPESMAPPLTFSAPDYRELYKAVAARTGQEAGSVKTALSTDTQSKDDGTVVSVAFSAPLETMLPEWTEKASQPQPDQTKFNTWKASVATHEAQHRAIYKTEYAKLKTQVSGPTKDDITTQSNAVVAAAEKVQDAFDGSNQPAALAIPGGIEKVKSTDASDVAPSGDTAMA